MGPAELPLSCICMHVHRAGCCRTSGLAVLRQLPAKKKKESPGRQNKCSCIKGSQAACISVVGFTFRFFQTFLRTVSHFIVELAIICISAM